MAMTVPWFDRVVPDERVRRSRTPKTRAPLDPALKVLLDRRDDRLLRDVGLTREEVLGEADTLRSELSRLRSRWIW